LKEVVKEIQFYLKMDTVENDSRIFEFKEIMNMRIPTYHSFQMVLFCPKTYIIVESESKGKEIIIIGHLFFSPILYHLNLKGW